jgi:hypothetical protein
MTRLDDLLGYDDGDLRRRVDRPVRYAILVGLGVIISAIPIRWVLGVFGLDVPYVLVLGVLAAFAGIRATVRLLHIRPVPSSLRQNPPLERWGADEHDGIHDAVRSWSGRLDYAQDNPRNFPRMIQPALVHIIEERIRLMHGVTRATDPHRFAQLVGPELSALLAGPVSAQVTPQMIATLVARMEAL